jgi:hypothetical protein
VFAVDTLCTDEDSGLFRRNGWTFLGHTKGYASNPSRVFSNRLDGSSVVKNNVALSKREAFVGWAVWAKILKKEPTNAT